MELSDQRLTSTVHQWASVRLARSGLTSVVPCSCELSRFETERALRGGREARAGARAFDRLLAERGDKQPCRTMVGLLALAQDRACEAELAAAIDADLAVGSLPDLDRLRDRFRPNDTIVPAVTVDLAPLSAYDELATIRPVAEVAP